MVIGTNNSDKLAEVRSILGAAGFEVLSPKELGGWEPPVEGDESIEANAILKARAAFETFGIPAVADDTALEVDALGGRPGVRSARYAGPRATYEENVAKLLRELEGVGSEGRRARFRTAAAAVGIPGISDPVIAVGEVTGTITESPRGSGGFGYDPVFIPDGFDKTFAEMDPEEKNAFSHRGRAFRSLAEKLRKAASLRGAD